MPDMGHQRVRSQLIASTISGVEYFPGRMEAPG
jgi:hypothetical protein